MFMKLVIMDLQEIYKALSAVSFRKIKINKEGYGFR